MRKLLMAGWAVSAMWVAGVAIAADHTVIEHHHGDGNKHTHNASAGAAVKAELADAEVRKVNKATGKITLKHGEIKSIEMPPMTMVFGVADPAMLEGLEVGDKVKIDVKQEGKNYTVTEIKKAK